MDTKIKSWLDDLPSKKRSLAMKLRKIVLSADPSIVENIKYNMLIFSNQSGNLVWLLNYPKTDYINFGFFKGAKLPDPKGLLEGTGKGLRHQKIHTEKEIDKKQAILWIKQSNRLNKKLTINAKKM